MSRSIISALVVVAVFNLLHWIIKRYLPELLTQIEVDKDDGADNDPGNRVNIVVPVDDLESHDFSGNEKMNFKEDESEGLSADDSFSPTIQKQENDAPLSAIEKKREAFIKEGPETLAKMIRTSLSKDDE